MRHRRFIFVATALLAAALGGCGGDGGSGQGGAGGNGNDFIEDSLELDTQARIVEASLRDDALLSSDPEAGEYIFDAGALAAAGVGIEVGNVLLIAELALIRVTSVTPQAGELVVQGTPATLPELIDRGVLAWDLELGAEGTPAPVLLIGDQTIAPKAGLEDGINYETMVNGFTISMNVMPQSSARQLEVQIVISRGLASDTVDFRAVATGTIRLFRHALDFEISDGATENWGFGTHNLEFDLEIEVAGANAGNAMTTFVLPGPFQLRFPIPTALPLGLNVAVTFNLLAEVELPPLASASTQMDATFRYQGSAGFRALGTSGFTTEGSNGSTSLEISDPNTAAVSGPVGFTVAAAVPRITLNALLDQVSARLDNTYSIAGTLLGAPLTGLCVESGGLHTLSGTVTAGFFGVSLAEFRHEFYRDDLFKDTGTCE